MYENLNISSTEKKLLYDIRELLIEINRKLDKQEEKPVKGAKKNASKTI